ncbi:MAG: hypothetical protein D3924_17180, partial [Candidatus Electrothrix sp. AR4]|nr:hypothetical protein [Candidatus Electrothrix sp. AR4]
NLKIDREAAAGLENECDKDWGAVNEKKIGLQLAIAKAVLNDIAVDPENDTVVETLSTELENLEGELELAQNAYAATAQENLDFWETAIPDHIWRNLINFGQAETLLSTVKDGTPAALETAKNEMDKAEKGLVAELEKQDKAARTHDFLWDFIAILEKRIEYSQKNRRERLHSAVRGDANTFSGELLYDLDLAESLIP